MSIETNIKVCDFAQKRQLKGAQNIMVLQSVFDDCNWFLLIDHTAMFIN